ncbi:phage tail sheath family protein [Pseudomaricurvus alcaniphilus]|uniref:phage tail sheath family protein n=1 Tax=Pseudomaricurvus alcaniphilus TaxID=1166482 RepID=UPI001408B6A7|nr:phage tail sheath C-terminal domain-containing protein [Pseudomaricurvus alcaniphilus]NHN38323.1 phage tail sheath family protein [Pseudomaricurvus alcaniphilus]
MAYGGITGIALGAPNVYRAPDLRQRLLNPARMDVCAFVGVAPRGPCRVPIEPDACVPGRVYLEASRPRQRSVAVAVESWTDYQRLYGGFEGPGRLPYAVASFFEQGGRRAYIARIVHHYGNSDDLAACARAILPDFISSAAIPALEAKSEGSWGNGLRAAVGYSSTPLAISSASSSSELIVDIEADVPLGSLLRLTVMIAGSPQYELRFVVQQGRRGNATGSQTERYLRFDSALTAAPVLAEIIEADILLEDGRGLRERFNRLGLSSEHPRWLAAVLYRESELVNPVDGWLESTLWPTDSHAMPRDPVKRLVDIPIQFEGGVDRYQDIHVDDFFDSGWVLGDPRPGAGIHALTHLRDLSQLVVPDLYVPEALPENLPDFTPVSVAGAEFATCVDIDTPAQTFTQLAASLPGLALDPSLPADLKIIIELQQKVVRLAEILREFIVLLDVPPGLSQAAIANWRMQFNSAFAAAYYPWLLQNNLQDQRAGLILLNPSAAAAGIIARQELKFGVPHGPANVVANNIVKVDETISPARHDQLHPLGINIYLQQPLGVWLSAARTLSLDPAYRQLSVRRLMTMLRRTLEQQMQWLVFEPNHPDLWAEVRHMLNNLLRGLFRQGAFKGRSAEEAYFVRCDASLNTQQVLDAGQLIVEIGVAPTEPLEFIVVRLTRGSDGTLGLEE